MDLEFGNLPIEKVLGIEWCVESDFSFPRGLKRSAIDSSRNFIDNWFHL